MASHPPSRSQHQRDHFMTERRARRERFSIPSPGIGRRDREPNLNFLLQPAASNETSSSSSSSSSSPPSSALDDEALSSDEEQEQEEQEQEEEEEAWERPRPHSLYPTLHSTPPPRTTANTNMPHHERDSSRDGEHYLKHQHSSSSDQGIRALIPMWDSSDPERAPPPLPLNPQSPSLTTRAPTGSVIQSAHAALSERVRESSYVPAMAKRMTETSPERAVVKGGSGHRRLQSMQPGSVRDLSLMIESAASPPNGSPTKSPERHAPRPSTPTAVRENPFESRIYDRDMNHSTPSLASSLTPIVRPTVRRPAAQSILGENTPPQSSTMLALQNMHSGSPSKEADPPLSNITNGSTGPAKGPTLENLYTQILGLTNIASSLQREMTALSRRSRDNATDLLSLKEATNTRDEDIRKSLRELVGNINDQSARLASRDPYSGYYLDNKPHCTSPTSGRAYQIPRIPSPKSFAESIDRASISTPSLVGAETSASMALLEKILRGLGTRDGQESLLGQLTELSEKLSGMATAAKVDELVDYVRSQSETAIVPINANAYSVAPSRRLSFDRESMDTGIGPTSPMAQRLLNAADNRRPSSHQGRGVDILNEDVLNIIRSVKDSVAQSGGMTAEVKALVRELRGEVLGMGRELGKRLENIGRKPVDDSESSSSASKDDVSRVIDEGLEQMKEQLNHVLREHRRQSAASSSQKPAIDYQEIYNALRNALKDNEAANGMPDLSRDDVIEAVREAWETYKPEIEVQQIGLERDEVLECLKQGLLEYESRNQLPPAATRDEVFTAVVEGMKHYVPPQVDAPATLSREEVMDAVRDCLEEFEFPVPQSATELTREAMLHAVREGLNELGLPRGDALVPIQNNDEVILKLHDLMEYMKLEFRAVSEEAKENTAASGRDTEQVLDATKDGLENLRIAIERYVDRASGITSQEEFMEGLLKTMDEFKDDVAALVSQANQSSREQLQTELEGLRDVVKLSMVPALPPPQANTEEILDVLRNGLSNLRQEILRPRPETSEILDALNDGLNELKAGIDRVTNKPVDLTANDEILDALKSGLDTVRSDIETIRDSSNDRALALRTVSNEIETHNAIVPVDMVRHDDIKNLEILISQLRIQVEEMGPSAESVHKSDLAHLEEMLRNLQDSVNEINSREPPAPPAPVPQAEGPKEESATDAAPAATNTDGPTREDVEAIETILRNTKSRLDDFIDGDQAVRKEHIDTVETLILETRETMRSLNTQMEAISSLSQKEDVSSLATIVTQVATGLEEMKERAEKDLENPQKVSKTDVEALEGVVNEIKKSVDGLAAMDFASVSTKDDFTKLETILKEAKDTFESYNDASSKALVDRQTDIIGVGERVTEIKTFLEEFQIEIKSKLQDGSTGVEALGKLLETLGEKVDKNENVGQDLKDMFDLMKSEFEISKEAMGGSRIEANEKLEEATEAIRTKIDDKVNELIAKYDMFQSALDEKSQAAEARDIVTEAAVVGTKAVADELKLLIDTLGSTVTDSLEKMEEASKTVFTKVEEMATRSEETHAEGKTEHQQTRDQIKEALTKVEGLQGDFGEFQPQILETVKSIFQLVGDHFEHSKTSAVGIQDKIVEVVPTEEKFHAMMPPPAEKYDDSEVRSKLDMLVEQKYDDGAVHEKLDKIVKHNDYAAQAFSQLETLDKVHQSVVRTAADLSEFLSNQTQRIADEHDDRERTLQETTVALERTKAEKEHVESSVSSLREEEERLLTSIMALRSEHEGLARQKTRLTGDVSALETALRLRKEELHEMEHRAEGLERRIFNGVMDHSRVLLLGKSVKNGGAETMSRKRVKKPTGAEASEKSSSGPAVAMALSSRRSLAPPAQNGAARRIASLSQMNNKAAPSTIKRSQSVKTQGSSGTQRKRSWGGVQKSGLGEEDKESLGVRETVEELDEGEMGAVMEDAGAVDDVEADGSDYDDDIDDARSDGTLRRTSGGTTVLTGTESGYSDYDDLGSELGESAEDAQGMVVVHGQ